MRLLIDIPDEMYYNARKGLLMGGDLQSLNEVISNGVPIPDVLSIGVERYGKSSGYPYMRGRGDV